MTGVLKALRDRIQLLKCNVNPETIKEVLAIADDLLTCVEQVEAKLADIEKRLKAIKDTADRTAYDASVRANGGIPD